MLVYKPNWVVIETTDPEDPTRKMFGVVPADDKDRRGLVIGDLESVAELHDLLDELLDTGVADDRLDPHDDRLGERWLTVSEAALLYGVPADTVRYAARHGHISLARKEGNELWRFPSRKFKEWFETVYSPRKNIP